MQMMRLEGVKGLVSPFNPVIVPTEDPRSDDSEKLLEILVRKSKDN